MNISEDLLKEVANKSLQNAKSLIDDAELLKQNNRLPRAYTLYQLAIEEVGKSILSFVLLVVPNGLNDENKKMYIDEFINHQHKAKRSRAMDIIVAEVLYKGNIAKTLSFLESSFNENVKELNNRKNFSLYTSVVKNEVRCPNEIINEEMVEQISFKALSRFNAANAFVETGLTNWVELKKYAEEQEKIGNKVTSEQFAKEFWSNIEKGSEG